MRHIWVLWKVPDVLIRCEQNLEFLHRISCESPKTKFLGNAYSGWLRDRRTDRKLIGTLRVYTNTLKNHVTEMSRAIPPAVVQFSLKVFLYLSPSFLLESPRFRTISFLLIIHSSRISGTHFTGKVPPEKVITYISVRWTCGPSNTTVAKTTVLRKHFSHLADWRLPLMNNLLEPYGAEISSVMTYLWIYEIEFPQHIISWYSEFEWLACSPGLLVRDYFLRITLTF